MCRNERAFLELMRTIGTVLTSAADSGDYSSRCPSGKVIIISLMLISSKERA